MTEKDSNDPVRISFTVPADDSSAKNEAWVFERLGALKEYDPGFYYKNYTSKMGEIFMVDTKMKNLEHAEFKKFMFQVKIKLGQDVKIR